MPEETPDPGSSGASATPQVPDKIYFRIGEVARLAGVPPYVLRYWETEFPEIAPKKFGTNHRQYRRKDVEMVLEIKRLLYDRRFTIEGARKHLSVRRKSEPRAKAPSAQPGLFGDGSAPLLQEIRRELEEILRMLR